MGYVFSITLFTDDNLVFTHIVTESRIYLVQHWLECTAMQLVLAITVAATKSFALHWIQSKTEP